MQHQYMGAIDPFLRTPVQLLLAHHHAPRPAKVVGYDEFGISIESEGEAMPKSFLPWSAVREIKLVPEQQSYRA